MKEPGFTMAWMQNRSIFKSYYQDALRKLSCCDLCFSNITTTVCFNKPLSQTLLCQECLNDLPYFNQHYVSGNLLTWPAINKALPKINFDQLFSLSPYIYPFNHWLAQFKYSGRFELGKLFGELLSAQWQSTMIEGDYPPVDLVICVPLHIKKWQLRGYNQAHLIAKHFAKQLSLHYHPSLITRVKNNDSQMGKTGAQRRKNLTNAFKLRAPLPNHSKHIVIVDDVVTTGTTANEITNLLKAAGVEMITLVTVCLSLPK